MARLRDRLGGRASVEQICALCDDINVETHFTEPYAKRGDGLYQSLFLNKQLVQPLDRAFDVAAVNVTGTTTEKISGHTPVMLAAFRISESDLALLKALTKASDNTAYITKHRRSVSVAVLAVSGTTPNSTLTTFAKIVARRLP